MGADGDGVSTLPGGVSLFFPDTLPGELVQPGTLSRRGEGWTGGSTVLEPALDRVVPPCPHFGPCGGCTLQHWRDDSYAAWKVGQVTDAMRRMGGPVLPIGMARTPPNARRRMDLAIRRDGPAIRIGLHRRRSRDIVDMQACPVLHPALFALIQALRPVLRRLQGLKRDGSAVVNLLDSGPDLLLRTDAELTSGDRTLLTALANAHGLPRISWAPGLARGSQGAPEPACLLRPATTALSGVDTPIPPGAFLQASREGEEAIVAAVLAALPPLAAKARILELFAGCGSITHALATRARVQAYEGDLAAYTALRRAANPRVLAAHRDLARQPLQAAELKGAGAIVLDPPHGGALAQVPALAASGIPVVYVSCNPAALARDGRVLLQAGYQAVSAAAVDQFLWSARVESVVGFTKGR
ncbi:MAG TPA: class I SAM-dependent RNA methyltransferase [Acetobacteraceae bacterium]